MLVIKVIIHVEPKKKKVIICYDHYLYTAWKAIEYKFAPLI
jgi:hypothetical protein